MNEHDDDSASGESCGDSYVSSGFKQGPSEERMSVNQLNSRSPQAHRIGGS